MAAVFNVTYYDDDYRRHLSYGLSARDVDFIKERFGDSNVKVQKQPTENARPGYIGKVVDQEGILDF